MTFLGKIGQPAMVRFRRLRYVAALAWAVLVLALRGRFWTRTVSNVLARQILFSGVEAISFVSVVAVLAGISIVVQAQMLMSRLGQSELLGPLLVTIIVREVGPLLVNFIVIGRSGTAMATELAGMSIHNEVRVLDAQGLEPMTYLVMPRVVALATSVLCLTLIFVMVSFGSGYLCGMLVGAGPTDPMVFLESVMRGMRPSDFTNLLAKTLIPGILTGVICCAEGLSVEAVTEVPQAVTRSVVRCNAAVLVVSVIVSVLSYV